jgi:hypothetical protein
MKWEIRKMLRGAGGNVFNAFFLAEYFPGKGPEQGPLPLCQKPIFLQTGKFFLIRLPVNPEGHGYMPLSPMAPRAHADIYHSNNKARGGIDKIQAVALYGVKIRVKRPLPVRDCPIKPYFIKLGYKRRFARGQGFRHASNGKNHCEREKIYSHFLDHVISLLFRKTNTISSG